MSKQEKTRGSKTYTESAFWSMIRSCLRQKSRWWKPIYTTKLEARRPNQSDNKRLKYEYQCVKCQHWFPDKEIEVDHITPVGSLKSGKDLEVFVENLFCEKEGLQILCKLCHLKNTKKQKEDAKIRI